jgi:hypothetical protein
MAYRFGQFTIFMPLAAETGPDAVAAGAVVAGAES